MPADDDALRLRDMTREMVLAGRLWRRLARHTAARHGMSEAASSPLVWIGRLGENVRQNALAEAVGIEGASLVRLVDELESLDLVVRQPDPSDRRANVLTLTETGRTVVCEVNADLTALRREVFAGLAPGDVEAALRVFAAVNAASERDDAQEG